MRQIAPLVLKERHWKEISDEIAKMFLETIFKPLFLALRESPIVENSNQTYLAKALKNGSVWFADGKFHGKFNARITKELKEIGATWNHKSKTWSYKGTLPASASLAIATASTNYTALKKQIIQTLDDINIASIDMLGDLPDKYIKTIEWMEGDWQKAVKGVTIAPQLTEGEQNSIAVDYAFDLGKYIKKWSEDAILELRQDVQAMVYEGNRPQSIAKLIINKYGQSVRKAEFLAKQETGLLMASFNKSRFESIGVQRFKWITSGDERVRHDHRILNNNIYFLNEPPIINQKTGARGLPKQDFGCRCDMMAILD